MIDQNDRIEQIPQFSRAHSSRNRRCHASPSPPRQIPAVSASAWPSVGCLAACSWTRYSCTASRTNEAIETPRALASASSHCLSSGARLIRVLGMSTFKRYRKLFITISHSGWHVKQDLIRGRRRHRYRDSSVTPPRPPFRNDGTSTAPNLRNVPNAVNAGHTTRRARCRQARNEGPRMCTLSNESPLRSASCIISTVRRTIQGESHAQPKFRLYADRTDDRHRDPGHLDSGRNSGVSELRGPSQSFGGYLRDRLGQDCGG